jgi:TonB family protein
MTLAFLICILCRLPEFGQPTNGFPQGRQKDHCDFSEYKPMRISDYRLPIKKSVEPEYPKWAFDAKIGGRVVVKVLIDLKGNVVGACAGEDYPLLKHSAIEAARKWKFVRNCRTCHGRKTKYMEEVIVFNFELNIPTQHSN